MYGDTKTPSDRLAKKLKVGGIILARRKSSNAKSNALSKMKSEVKDK